MRFKNLLLLILTLSFISNLVFANSFFAWADNIVEKLKIETLKSSYAKKLLFPPKNRIPTVTTTEGNDIIVFRNIHDNSDLWIGYFPLAELASAEIINIPIAPGAFHYATFFYFKNALTIKNSKGESKTIKGIAMGTGPEKDYSLQGILGLQLIQMRTHSIEYYETINPIKPKYRHKINTNKVDLTMLFLAHVEEAARLAAMTYLRALSAEKPDIYDMPIFQKYNIFGANCVSSGIQNLARAIRPEYQKTFLEIGKKDISKLELLTPNKLIYWINSWHQVSLQALGTIIGRVPDQTKFKELEIFHKQLRRTNQMSLPWRAKRLIEWATR